MVGQRTLTQARMYSESSRSRSNDNKLHSIRMNDETIPLPRSKTGFERFCKKYAPSYCSRCGEDCLYKLMVD